jgi:transcriptional regulator with XRE-family HTH domain
MKRAKKPAPRSAGKHDLELGKRIRLRRVEQGISQAELGSRIGISFQQVQKYEKGVNRVGAARLQQIATALDVPVTFFYDGDGKAREVDSLLFLDSSFSQRLLRAYAAIKDQTIQRQLVTWESIAEAPLPQAGLWLAIRHNGQRPDRNASSAWAIKIPMLKMTRIPKIFVNMRMSAESWIRGQMSPHSQSKS